MTIGNRITQWFVLVCSVLAFTQAAAMEVSGVKLDDSAHVANADLKLNGAGTRYKFIIKVYAAGLYLPEHKSTTADVLALNGPKRVTLTMLRKVTSDTFSQSFLEGIHNNTTAEERSSIFNQMLAFGQMFGSYHSLNEGDTLNIDWVPNVGTVVFLNGKKISESLPDATFYNALLKIWLGDHPVEPTLKRNMLGFNK